MDTIDARRGTANRRAALVVVTALAIANLLPAAQVTLWPDTVRDLSASLALARGEAFPLSGPSINLGPHLGPAWIWLQAAVLVFFSSLTAVAVYVAAVASLKFYFLYGLGRVLEGDDLGVCLAVAAALPSIGTYQWMVFFHPNWVEAGIAAALLLAALAWKRGSIALVHASAAVLGLAIQLHPTAAFYFPVLIAVLVGRNLRGWRLVGHGFVALLAVLVWFLPLLFASGQPQAGIEGPLTRFGAGLRGFAASDVLTALRTAYVDVPLAVGDTYGARAGMPAGAWRSSLLVASVGVAIGVVMTIRNPGRQRRVFAALLGVVLAGWMAATAVRTYTPFYLCYSLLPLSCLVIGLALRRTTSSNVIPIRIAGWAAVAAIAVCFIAAAWGARLTGIGAHIESRLPLIADLKHPAQGEIRATLVTASARDALARHVCARTGGTRLHGELAYALAASASLDLRLHCPDRVAQVTLLGTSGEGSALTGLAASDAGKLGMKPVAHFKGLGAFEVKQAVHPQEGRAIEPWYYFEQLKDRQTFTRISLTFTSDPGEAVMVYRLKPFDSRWQGFSVTRNGEAIPAALSTHNSDVFRSHGEGRSHWRIEFETDAPQWVDVHVF